MQRVRKQLGCSDRLQFEAGIEGVTVAVLDTGISHHPDLEGRILSFVDFVNHKAEIYDDNGHGTHVAGCIGGSGKISRGIYKGIAPRCHFCIGKILDDKGEGSAGCMEQALEWMLVNIKRYKIRVLNISVGLGENANNRKMQRLEELIESIWDLGVVVVCAAGNSGPGEGSISPFGCLEKVITVGCHEGGYFGMRKDLCEYYSARGSDKLSYVKPDLVAPGTDIVSCNGNWLRGKRGELIQAYAKKSGTSMAAPIVSGAAALLLQRYPEMKNTEVKRKMIYSAKNIGENKYMQGWGMLDIGKLFQIC